MHVVDIPMDHLWEAGWNPNQMDSALNRLRVSHMRYGMVANLVVRPLPNGAFEVLSGNHRLGLLKELGQTTAPCVVVDLGNAQVRLLA